MAVVLFEYIVLGAASLCTLLFSIFVVSLFRHRYESSRLASTVTVLGLTLCLVLVLLIPVDVYNVSMGIDSSTGERTEFFQESLIRAPFIKLAYHITFASALVYIFVLAPFSYFFWEEDELDISRSSQFFAALKYTVFTLVIAVALLVLGTLLKTNSPDEAADWLKELLKGQSRVDLAILFATSALSCFAVILWVLYCPYGLAALPLALLSSLCKPKRVEDDMMDELKAELAVAKDVKRSLQARSRNSGVNNKALKNAERRELLLSKQLKETKETAPPVKILTVLAPFFGLLGLLCLVFTLVIVVSYATTLVEMLSRHDDLSKFVVSVPRILNPLDFVLTKVSSNFYLSIITLTIVAFYLLVCLLYSVSQQGVRIICIKIYKFTLGKTSPQGLLLTSVFIVLCLFSFTVASTSIAPTYISFGSQTFYNSTVETVQPCYLGVVNTTDCQLTQIGTLVTIMSNLLPSMSSLVFLYSGVGFCIMFVVSLMWVVLRRCCCGDKEEEDDDFMD
ncbi:hypothetical protein RCL1_000915 [Eukaryota sp. TZLM3-RCL]